MAPISAAQPTNQPTPEKWRAEGGGGAIVASFVSRQLLVRLWALAQENARAFAEPMLEGYYN